MSDWWSRTKRAVRRAVGQLQGDYVPVDTGESAALRPAGAAAEAPPLDAYENEHELLLVLDVPGVRRDGIQIVADRARQRLEVVAGGATTQWVRTLDLPSHADVNAAEGSLRRGVLRIRIPRKAAAQPLRIPVRAAP